MINKNKLKKGITKYRLVKVAVMSNFFVKLKSNVHKEDYDEIKGLEYICIKNDNISFKFELDYKLSILKQETENIDEINEFLLYDKNILIGYLGICDFGGEALEANGMIHPSYRKRKLFTKLFSLTRDEFQKREKNTMLMLSDNKSISGIQFIKNVCNGYDHSEYDMVLKKEIKYELKFNNILLRKAEFSDATLVAKMDSLFFNMNLNEDTSLIIENIINGTTYIVELNNETIGKIRLENIEGVGGIYGFGVLSEYRRKGYGGEILNIAIKLLKKRNAKIITLQVETKNSNALNLYKSFGFEENYVMDYYKISKRDTEIVD